MAIKFKIAAEFSEEGAIDFAKRKGWDGVSNLADFLKVQAQQLLVQEIVGEDLDERFKQQEIIESKKQADAFRQMVGSKIVVDVEAPKPPKPEPEQEPAQETETTSQPGNTAEAPAEEAAGPGESDTEAEQQP